MPIESKSDVEAAYDGGDIGLNIGGESHIYFRDTDRVIKPERIPRDRKLVVVGPQILDAVMPKKKEVEPDQVMRLSDLFSIVGSVTPEAIIMAQSREVKRLIAELCPDFSIDPLIKAHEGSSLLGKMARGHNVPPFVSHMLSRDGENGKGKHDPKIVFNLALALKPGQDITLLKQKLGILF